MTFDSAQLGIAAPLLVILFFGVLLLMLEAFAGGRSRGYLMPVTLVGCGLALGFEFAAWQAAGAQAGSRAIFNGMVTADRLSIFVDCAFLIAAALTAMLAESYMQVHRFEFGEFYSLLLFATAGMIILGAATDLVSVFIGVETMSIAVYVLTGSWRRSPRSSEAAMKYFLNGAFATAILLYGIALLYGAVGSTSLRTIAENASRLSGQPIFIIGALLVLVALCFKIAAVPFHMWAPDAYEGAPTPVTAFMAAGVKTAAFAAIIRVFGGTLGRNELAFGPSGWASILSVVAIATMTLGNLAALKQDNIKRLLAYSSIAHAGYLLVGVVAMAVVGNEARGPLLFYLVSYTFTTIGAFGVVAWIGDHDDERLQIDDWAGLASRHPAAALAMTIFLLSLGGIPPTAGFFGKFYLFRAALAKPGMLPLVIIAVLNSVVSVAYYLRIITAMYFREVGREVRPIQARGMTAAILIAALATLAIGVLPSWLIDAAGAALGS
jgi:NADH-quinone oxidoreductase subunit N